MAHEGTTDTNMAGNSTQAWLGRITANRPQEQTFTFNRGPDWFNASNMQDGNFLSRSQLYDQVMDPKFQPNQLYKSADEAYNAYLEMSPYGNKSGTGPNQFNKQWADSWNPIFLPYQQQAGSPQAAAAAAGPTRDGRDPSASGPQNSRVDLPNPHREGAQNALNSLSQRAFGPPASLGWANQGWQENQLHDTERYGDFAVNRGL